MDRQIHTTEHISVCVLHILQGLTALKSLGKQTVTASVKMGHAFKYHLHPSNASVTLVSLAHCVRRGKPPVTQIHVEMVVHVKRVPQDLFAIVRNDLRASTANLELTSIASRTHVGRNKCALQGIVALNVSVQMVVWPQRAGGRTACVVHHHV